MADKELEIGHQFISKVAKGCYLDAVANANLTRDQSFEFTKNLPMIELAGAKITILQNWNNAMLKAMESAAKIDHQESGLKAQIAIECQKRLK